MKLDDECFKDCSSLSEIDLPTQLYSSSFGRNVFYGCGFKSFNIPASFREVPPGFLSHNENLENVTFPESLVKIGDEAFQGCVKLSNYPLRLPDSLTDIGTCCFQDCRSLTFVIVSDKINDIPAFAFSGCVNLSVLLTRSSLISIGEGAFYGCGELVSKLVDATVTNIGPMAFYGCQKIEKLELSPDLRELGDKAFWGCSEIKSVYYLKDDGDLLEANKNVWENANYANMTLCVTEKSLNSAKSKNPWKKFGQIRGSNKYQLALLGSWEWVYGHNTGAEGVWIRFNPDSTGYTESWSQYWNIDGVVTEQNNAKTEFTYEVSDASTLVCHYEKDGESTSVTFNYTIDSSFSTRYLQLTYKDGDGSGFKWITYYELDYGGL